MQAKNLSYPLWLYTVKCSFFLLLQFDPKKAQALSKQLPQLDLTQAIDVDALETSSWMMGTKVIKKTVAKVEASPGSKPG
jgi:hypothetical protein